ncbi:MAG: hypothetical protein LQ347_001592 [Umbilicaria vellea]|nr:MAG: hypothetical protein LQ347_001592 [Umbilicaria vellea]
MTTRVVPRAERPAERAKGTVRPSERPMVASEMRRAEEWVGVRGTRSKSEVKLASGLERRGSSCEEEEELEARERENGVPVSRSV